jgi:hypothetical protein
MKRILVLLSAALIALSASAATLVPIQLLNPAGSTSGQAIISTGASTAPAWGGVPVGGLAAIAANTVLANATASSAGPTAFAMPSCTGATNALGYTSGTGIICNGSINAATLGGQTFTSPTITTPNIIATTTGTTAPAGSVSYYQTASTAAASAATGTPLNVASTSLSPGVWDVQCTAQYVLAGSTVQQLAEIGVSTTSVTLGAYPTITESSGVTSAGFGQVFTSPRVPLNITTTTTVFCVAQANFTVSTMQIAGTIGAWLRH